MNYFPYQQRVIDEAEELSSRIVKLNQFIDSPPFRTDLNQEETGLLKEQASHMTAYLGTLHRRIGRWNQKRAAEREG